jgi:hypothetical protein
METMQRFVLALFCIVASQMERRANGSSAKENLQGIKAKKEERLEQSTREKYRSAK